MEGGATVVELVGAYVVDASVAVKWFSSDRESNVAEARALRAAHLRREATLLAPQLLVYEVTNALRYNPALDDDHVAEAAASLMDMSLELVAPSETVLRRAVRLAFAGGISFYDAVYLALADTRHCLFVTSDDKLRRKLVAHPRVVSLSEFTA